MKYLIIFLLFITLLSGVVYATTIRNALIRNATIEGLPAAAPADQFLLLEDGSFLLLEDGGKLILE